MRSRGRVVIWLAALFLVVGSVTPAAAKKGIDCGANPDHPSCVSEEGGTCEDGAVGGRWAKWNPDVEPPKLVTLTPEAPTLCIDLSSTVAAKYRVEFTATDNVRGAAAGVRDSHPGDHCGGFRSLEFSDVSPGVLILPGPDSGWDLIPASSLDACGDEWSDSDPALAFSVVADFRRKPASPHVEITITRCADEACATR